MDITQLFTDLSHGELSNLAMSGEGSGEIREKDRAKIISYTNEGLLRLYSRFVLKENDLVIELVDHITNYHLIPKFAESNFPEAGEDYPYIKDLHREKFEGDVIRIMAVYSNTQGQMPLNDDNAYFSLFTPQGNVLQFPNPVTGHALSIHYQAKHPPLSLDNMALEIQLQDTLQGALKAYIAYKVYSHMNMEGSVAAAQGHLGMYEAICQEVIDRDLVANSVSTTNTRFAKRGWI